MFQEAYDIIYDIALIYIFELKNLKGTISIIINLNKLPFKIDRYFIMVGSTFLNCNYVKTRHFVENLRKFWLFWRERVKLFLILLIGLIGFNCYSALKKKGIGDTVLIINFGFSWKVTLTFHEKPKYCHPLTVEIPPTCTKRLASIFF